MAFANRSAAHFDYGNFLASITGKSILDTEYPINL